MNKVQENTQIVHDSWLGAGYASYEPVPKYYEEPLKFPTKYYEEPLKFPTKYYEETLKFPNTVRANVLKNVRIGLGNWKTVYSTDFKDTQGRSYVIKKATNKRAYADNRFEAEVFALLSQRNPEVAKFLPVHLGCTKDYRYALVERCETAVRRDTYSDGPCPERDILWFDNSYANWGFNQNGDEVVLDIAYSIQEMAQFVLHYNLDDAMSWVLDAAQLEIQYGIHEYTTYDEVFKLVVMS